MEKERGVDLKTLERNEFSKKTMEPLVAEVLAGAKDDAQREQLKGGFERYKEAIIDLALANKNAEIDSKKLIELGHRAYVMEQERKAQRAESVAEMQRLTAKKQQDVALDKAVLQLARERRGEIVKPEKTVDLPQVAGQMKVTSGSAQEQYTQKRWAEIQKDAARFAALRETVPVPKATGKMELTSASAMEFGAQDLAKAQAEADAKRMRVEQALKTVGGIETKKIDVGEVPPELIAAHPIVENTRADDMQKVARQSAEFRQSSGGRMLELSTEGEEEVPLETSAADMLSFAKERMASQRAAEESLLKKYFANQLQGGEFPPNFNRAKALELIKQAESRVKKAA